MKKFITLLLMALLCAALCMGVYAADEGFNAALDISKGDNFITVTVTDSTVLQEKQPSLFINCDESFDGALLFFDGVAGELEYDEAKGGVSFKVSKGGSYHIVKGAQPVAEEPGKLTYEFGGESFVMEVELPPAPIVPIVPSEPAEPETETETEITENADGSTTTTVTDKETGAVTETTETPEGVSATVKTDGEGKVTEITAEIPADADSAGAVELPIEVSAADEPEISIVTNSAEPVTVAIGVSDVTPGTVAVLVDDEGKETVIAATALTEDGIAAPVPDGATVKIVDRSLDFEDVKEGQWHCDAVDFVSARGLMQGTGEDIFEPKTPTTRAMVWTILARLEGVDTDGGEKWYSAAQDWAVENGISDGTMATEAVTREQLVTMLWRYIGEPESDHDLSGFTDHGDTSAWALEAKQWAVELGIIEGVSDTLLAPGGDATRAQLAQMLMRFIGI